VRSFSLAEPGSGQNIGSKLGPKLIQNSDCLRQPAGQNLTLSNFTFVLSDDHLEVDPQRKLRDDYCFSDGLAFSTARLRAGHP